MTEPCLRSSCAHDHCMIATYVRGHLLGRLQPTRSCCCRRQSLSVTATRILAQISLTRCRTGFARAHASSSVSARIGHSDRLKRGLRPYLAAEARRRDHLAHLPIASRSQRVDIGCRLGEAIGGIGSAADIDRNLPRFALPIVIYAQLTNPSVII
jgi:hypothetical protein